MRITPRVCTSVHAFIFVVKINVFVSRKQEIILLEIFVTTYIFRTNDVQRQLVRVDVDGEMGDTDVLRFVELI